MNYFIVDTLFGSFLLDESATVKKVVSFGTDAKAILAKLEEYAKDPQNVYNALLPVSDFKKDDKCILEVESLVPILKQILPCDVQTEAPSKGGEILRASLFKQLEKSPWKLAIDSAISICREVNQTLSRNGIKVLSTQADQQVKQAIETIDDIDKSVNLFSSRLREWYGLHFPELTDNLIADHLTFAKITVQIGKRDQFSSQKLSSLLNLNENLANTVANNASSSMGAEITDFDMSAIQRFAQNIINIYDLRVQTEHYIDAMMSQVAPNIQTLVGSLVGARLISLAGSLRILALKPASTIQILGAEKALFRALKSPTATSPKHGVIFQWPPLRTAKFWLRGKIARAVAGKLAIAAKADFFTGSYIGDELAADLRKRMADIEKKYPEAPKQEKKPPAPRRREGGFSGGGRKGKSFQKRGDRSFGRGPNRPRDSRGPKRPRPTSKGGNN